MLTPIVMTKIEHIEKVYFSGKLNWSIDLVLFQSRPILLAWYCMWFCTVCVPILSLALLCSNHFMKKNLRPLTMSLQECLFFLCLTEEQVIEVAYKTLEFLKDIICWFLTKKRCLQEFLLWKNSTMSPQGYFININTKARYLVNLQTTVMSKNCFCFENE